jgi:transcriptional regulator with XRE-family HTH domain
MDARSEIQEFLTSRRARLKPAEAGLPMYGDVRRVPGLRREEVAMLAGVSVDYYTRLERGNMSGVSEGVLESVSRALHLDEAERAHLHDLARATRPTTRTRRQPVSHQVRPNVQRILDSMVNAPAFVRNARFDLLAANPLGRALYAPIFDQPVTAGQRPNTARFVFLDPRAHEFYPNWEQAAEDVVSMMRSEAGRNPHDPVMTDLVGELCIQSEVFAAHWAKHNVRFHCNGTKLLHHPVVGELQLDFERLQFEADQGAITLYAYTADPGSRSEEALRLLGSWAATEAAAQAQASTGGGTRTPTGSPPAPKAGASTNSATPARKLD